MKNIFGILFVVMSLNSYAHEIQGTLVKEGKYKSSTVISGTTVQCNFQVKYVRNILDDQDDFGNPGYRVRTLLTVSGSNKELGTKIKHTDDITFINIFSEGSKKIVKDEEYFAVKEQATLKINNKGLPVRVSFPFENKFYSCHF